MTQTVVNVPAAGAFDPSDITITDDTSGAFLIKEGSNEYMRINTTNGSEQMVLKGNPGGAGTLQYAGLFLVTNPYFQGSDNNNVQLTTSGIVLQTGNAGNRCDVYAINSGNSFRVVGTGGAERFKVLDDSNATFTLDSGNNAVFKVQDDLASPTQFLTIDSNTSSESIKLALTPQNADRFLEMTSSKVHARCQNSQLNMGTQGITFTAYDDYTFGQFGAGKKLLFKDNQTAEERFSVDKESNATFTLDDGSAATFTITDNASPTPALHLRCTESATPNPSIEVNGLVAFPTRQLTLTSNTYGTAFYGSANQARLSVSLGATSATRNVNIGAVNMDAFAQILTATPSTTGQTFTLDFNNTSTALSGLPISLYKLVLKNAGTESCTFTAASTMASGGRVKGVDISGASIGVIDSSSGSITAAAGETIYVEVTNHVSDSAGGASNRFIICKTICKI